MGHLTSPNRSFFWFCFRLVIFCSLGFCFSFCWKEPQSPFSCNFRGFFSLIFFPQKSFHQNPSSFSSALPFNIPSLLLPFSASTPCDKTFLCVFSFRCIFLSFCLFPVPFFIFASFLQSNFPDIPFFKPKLPSYLAVLLLRFLPSSFGCLQTIHFLEPS